jgi:hypothetical protein
MTQGGRAAIDLGRGPTRPVPGNDREREALAVRIEDRAWVMGLHRHRSPGLEKAGRLGQYVVDFDSGL